MEDLEDLLAQTNFDEREKNRWRRLVMESEPDDFPEIRASLIAQQYDCEE